MRPQPCSGPHSASVAPRGQLSQEVDVDLGAGAAGAAGPGGAPEVLPAPFRLLVEGPDALGGHAGGAPQRHRLLVRGQPGPFLPGPGSGPHPVGADPQVLRDELVAVGDRFGLEVAPLGGAPEGEVAQHLEEGVVGVVAHGVDVVVEATGAQAALDGDHPPGGGPGGVEVEGLELLHPGAVEEDAGVALHHQGATGEVQVPQALEIRDEAPAYFLTTHESHCNAEAVRRLRGAQGPLR